MIETIFNLVVVKNLRAHRNEIQISSHSGSRLFLFNFWRTLFSLPKVSLEGSQITRTATTVCAEARFLTFLSSWGERMDGGC